MTCAWCLLISGTLTILHPVILYQDFYLFLACRFLTGVLEIFFYVSTADIFSRWFPNKERATLISFSFNGTNIGAAIVYTFCGYLAHRWVGKWRSMLQIRLKKQPTKLDSYHQFQTSFPFLCFRSTARSWIIGKITAMSPLPRVIIVNLAPEHSSVVAGIESTVYSLSAIAAQTITGFMITNHSSQEWNNCFYLAAVISTLGAVIFALYGSSETQPWASTSPTKEE
ncbi:hypothetical protein U1Q18_051704, partial [Sarracenia purpurea var. burkii]